MLRPNERWGHTYFHYVKNALHALLGTIAEQPPIFWTILEYCHFNKKVWDIIAVTKVPFIVKVLQELALSCPIEELPFHGRRKFFLLSLKGRSLDDSAEGERSHTKLFNSDCEKSRGDSDSTTWSSSWHSPSPVDSLFGVSSSSLSTM